MLGDAVDDSGDSLTDVAEKRCRASRIVSGPENERGGGKRSQEFGPCGRSPDLCAASHLGSFPRFDSAS
jgi:hypothetical protein